VPELLLIENIKLKLSTKAQRCLSGPDKRLSVREEAAVLVAFVVDHRRSALV